MDLIPSQVVKDALNQAAQNVWDTFKRPFVVYVNAQVATIVTNPAYSMFGQTDQMVFNPAVTPQPTTIYGTILYGNNQPWEYIAPENRTNYQQDKIRNSMGVVRIKVDITGYSLMAACKQVILDGWTFNLVSTPRPHGVFNVQRWTFFLQKAD